MFLNRKGKGGKKEKKGRMEGRQKGENLIKDLLVGSLFRHFLLSSGFIIPLITVQCALTRIFALPVMCESKNMCFFFNWKVVS